MSVSPYAVRDVPRGVVIGTVRSRRLRDWVATCFMCSTDVVDTTRPATEGRLRSHVHRVHWSPR